MRHLKRHLAPERIACEIIRPLRLVAADRFDIICRHSFHGHVERRLAVYAVCLQSVERLLAAQVPREVAEKQDLPRSVMDAIERRERPGGT